MLHACKAPHAFGNCRGLDSRECRGRGGGKNIFNVMIAAQADVTAAQDHCFGAVAPEDNFIVPEEASDGHPFLPAEPENRRARGRVLLRGGVVRVQDGGIFFCLIFEYARFRAAIGFEGYMAVEMNRSDIEKKCEVRTKSGNRFELEAAGFDDSEAGVT